MTFKIKVKVPEIVFNQFFLSYPGAVSVKIKVNTSYNYTRILFKASLHHSGQFHMGAIFAIGTSNLRNTLLLIFGLYENAWFPWKPIMRFSRLGVYLQNLS